jgi:hypothetical protein
VARFLEPHRAGARTVALDDEPAEPFRLPRRPLDLGGDPVSVGGVSGAEERLCLLAVQEVDEPVDILRVGPADRDLHLQAVTSAISASSGS